MEQAGQQAEEAARQSVYHGWLAPEEQRLWELMNLAAQRVEAKLDQALESCGSLTRTEFHLLAALARAPGYTLRLKELSEALDWAHPRVSKQISRMSRRGLVSKSTDGNDRRAVRARITEDGKEELGRAVPAYTAQLQRTIFDRLAPGEADVVRRLLASVAEEGPDVSAAAGC
ncbi:MarR family winged helix-turn-helix transcriptional regulator [Corynebacterium sp. 32222D000AT]|uniref:MarR family winged helix-turn-helix transcriptional regulator n=1 Tax=unclassified Corynebacterium TaxID=2624378 RepID=UPI002A92FA8F|nr:MarR family winged helix-turn-helix transcriptional regulator [Mycobacteriaceae bacterium]MDY5829310.1 MarR family winged helix-turn-helix transcriptional regulator [Corynebacterium sp.]